MLAVDRLLTQAEAANFLRTTIKNLQRLRRTGRLGFVRMGHRSIRIPSSELSKFLGGNGNGSGDLYQGDLVKSLVESVERAEGGQHSPVTTFEPDPILAPEAGQFFTVQLLDHLETCCEEDCENETRVAVRFSDGERSYDIRAMCKDHIHCEYANWMVGA